MALSLPERVPLDEISVRAQRIRIRPGRAVLTVLAAVFFALGFASARTVTGVWLAVSWSAAAVMTGWQEGRKGVSRGAA